MAEHSTYHANFMEENNILAYKILQNGMEANLEVPHHPVRKCGCLHNDSVLSTPNTCKILQH